MMPCVHFPFDRRSRIETKSLFSVAPRLPCNARVRRLSHSDVRKVGLGAFYV